MQDLIHHLTIYLEETLGIAIRTERWPGCNSLPVFMQSLYDCYTASILNEHCLLLVNRDGEAATPAAIRKHIALINGKWQGPVIYAGDTLASYDRRRLVQYKVPFVIPGNQLYLPDIGVDMREHFRKARTETRLFSPSAQVVVLHALIAQDYGPFTSTQLANKLCYTAMTAKRAIDEIESAEVGSITLCGRERELRFESTGRELWEKALPFLRNPVQKLVTAIFPSGAVIGIESGLTALSRYSMISAPVLPTLAVSMEVWKNAKANQTVHETRNKDEDVYQIEIWRYDPVLLSDEYAVDRLSLYLSLRDSSDERIEKSLDDMMENMPW